MSLAVKLQPDQDPERWNNHVAVYEEVFEPLTSAFARRALDHLNVGPGDRLIDIGAGAGGAALIAAARGGDVVAMDASPASYAWQVGFAQSAGLTEEELLGVLVALAPTVGNARIVSAAVDLAFSLGHEVDELK